MSLRALTVVWLVITFWLSLEYLGAHGYIAFKGIMLEIQCALFDSCRIFDPRPGKPISYFFGWLGFGIMALTNAYILRKGCTVSQSWELTRLARLAHIFRTFRSYTDSLSL